MPKYAKKVLIIFAAANIITFFGGYMAGQSQWLGTLIIVFALPPMMYAIAKGMELAIQGTSASATPDNPGESTQDMDALPPEYKTIEGFYTDDIKIDRVVIGPTGLFMVRELDLNGHISSNGRGELTVNKKNTDRPEIRIMVKAVMSTKERIKAMCDMDPYFQGVIALPESAQLRIRRGSTKNIHCMGRDRIAGYITSKKKNTLSAYEIATLGSAFEKLAIMDN